MYTWAGKVRTVDLARSGQMSFARIEHIDSCLRSLFDFLLERAFISQLARGAGFAVQWFQISRDEMYAASQRSFQYGDSTEIERLLLTATHPIKSANETHHPH